MHKRKDGNLKNILILFEGLLIFAGLAMVLAAVSADWLGIGGKPGLGQIQQALIIFGSGLVIIGNIIILYIKRLRAKTSLAKNLFLILISLILSITLFEAMARIFIMPCHRYYADFLGHHLLPAKIVSDRFSPYKDHNRWHKNMVVGGQRITTGDLWGIYRYDEILGNAPKENAISANGWWRSNNIGARSASDTSKHKAPGKKRIIIFGDSFTNCGRARQEESWPYLLDSRDDNIEFLNFGVEEYSSGQCLLRYRAVKERIDHDLVMLIFTPHTMLLREINVHRRSMVHPRFILKDGRLQLIKMPYTGLDDFYRDNYRGLSARLKKHLETYDRLYFEEKYKETPFIGRSILYKLIAGKYYAIKKEGLSSGAIKTDSEAMQITKKVFHTMNEEVKDSEKKLIIFVLPTAQDLKQYTDKHSYRKRWDQMVTSIRGQEITCIDLMEDLSKRLYDRSGKAGNYRSYDSKTNRVVAELVWKHMKRLGVI